MNTLDNLLTWGETQLEIILFTVLIITLLFTAFKRAWIAMIGTLVTLAFIAIFVTEPTMLISLAEWVAGKLKRG